MNIQVARSSIGLADLGYLYRVHDTLRGDVGRAGLDALPEVPRRDATPLTRWHYVVQNRLALCRVRLVSVCALTGKPLKTVLLRVLKLKLHPALALLVLLATAHLLRGHGYQRLLVGLFGVLRGPGLLESSRQVRLVICKITPR